MQDNTQSNYNWIIVLIIGIMIGAFFFGNNKYENFTAEEWFNEYDQCSADLEGYKSALEEANNNIDEVNSQIDDAQYCSYGCTYDEMQYAINNLEPAEAVEP